MVSSNVFIFYGFDLLFLLKFFFFFFFFFFQAEDGIRDLTVTGVQTCALPISWRVGLAPPLQVEMIVAGRARPAPARTSQRSEERRVGKEGRSRWGPDQ